MTVEFKEIEFAASQLAHILNQVPDQIERLKKEIQLCDLETTDLLHLIELSSFNASDGYGLARDLQLTQQQRRKCKNELESLTSFYAKSQKSRTMKQQSDVINTLVEQRKQSLADKQYSPRVRLDLVERFRKCKKNKVLNVEV